MKQGLFSIKKTLECFRQSGKEKHDCKEFPGNILISCLMCSFAAQSCDSSSIKFGFF
jgi:hypothetical protein